MSILRRLVGQHLSDRQIERVAHGGLLVLGRKQFNHIWGDMENYIAPHAKPKCEFCMNRFLNRRKELERRANR